MTHEPAAGAGPQGALEGVRDDSTGDRPSPGRPEHATPGGGPRGAGPAGRIDGADRELAVGQAMAIFGDHGFSGATIEMLAEAGGRSPAEYEAQLGTKQEVYDEVMGDALLRFAGEVERRIFSRTGALERLHGYLDIYRELHREQRAVLRFLSRAVAEPLGLSVDIPAGILPHRGGDDPGEPMQFVSTPLRALVEVVVSQARAKRELSDAVTDAGVSALLQALTVGISFAVLDAPEDLLDLLDALGALVDGTVFPKGGASA